ncbi:MAG: hypothetical protein WBA74_26040 [Cyclobacteriaceae bacterium]
MKSTITVSVNPDYKVPSSNKETKKHFTYSPEYKSSENYNFNKEYFKNLLHYALKAKESASTGKELDGIVYKQGDVTKIAEELISGANKLFKSSSNVKSQSSGEKSFQISQLIDPAIKFFHDKFEGNPLYEELFNSGYINRHDVMSDLHGIKIEKEKRNIFVNDGIKEMFMSPARYYVKGELSPEEQDDIEEYLKDPERVEEIAKARIEKAGTKEKEAHQKLVKYIREHDMTILQRFYNYLLNNLDKSIDKNETKIEQCKEKLNDSSFAKDHEKLEKEYEKLEKEIEDQKAFREETEKNLEENVPPKFIRFVDVMGFVAILFTNKVYQTGYTEEIKENVIRLSKERSELKDKENKK